MEYIEGGPESATMEFDVKDVSEFFSLLNLFLSESCFSFSLPQSLQLM